MLSGSKTRGNNKAPDNGKTGITLGKSAGSL